MSIVNLENSLGNSNVRIIELGLGTTGISRIFVGEDMERLIYLSVTKQE